MHRRHRRVLFTVVYSAAFAIVLMLFWGTRSMTWQSTAPGLGVRESRYGLLPYLVVRTESVSSTGAPGPEFRRTLGWRGHAVLLAALATVFSALVLRLAYLASVARYRLVGRCDECGYSLVGLRSPTCPECGTRVSRTADRALRPQRSMARRNASRIVVLGIAWLAVMSLVWLGGRTMTVRSGPGADVRINRRWGLPTYLVSDRVLPGGSPAAATARRDWRTTGLVLVVVESLIWTGLVVVAFRRWTRRPDRAVCPSCGFAAAPDADADAGCPVCGLDPRIAPPS